MQSARSNGGDLKICSLLPEQRKGIFDLVQFTIRNSSRFSDGKFAGVVV